ncbi:MAG: cysteine rich repeat-containing protein [Anaeromyxobacter sp.]
MRRSTLLLALAAAVVALAAAPTRADTPCTTDAARLCPGTPAEGGQLWDCLLRNQLQLSTACQRNIQEVQRRAGEFSARCGGDVWRYCPRVTPGEGRVVACLSSHLGRSELSTPCEEAVSTALEKARVYGRACATDAANLCPGVAPGGGRVVLCLRGQAQKLSSACKKAVGL